MTRETALETLRQAMHAADAAGDDSLKGSLATLYYKVTTLDFNALPVMG